MADNIVYNRMASECEVEKSQQMDCLFLVLKKNPLI
jgi:hypothetical protein